ncbi:MAG: hypothetical protein ACRDUV_13465 [Pseudonocardiaceae bacterium]
MTTRTEAINRAGWVLAETYRQMDEMTPREQAEAAWTPGDPSFPTVDALEAHIRHHRRAAS